MRVLFITQVVDRSHENLGAIHGWIAALAREVERVHVLTLETGAIDLPPNVSVHSVGKDRGHGKLRQLRAFQLVAGRLALRRQIDIFFAHMVPRYALLVAPYRLILGIPTAMWYAHNSADLRLRLANLCVDRFVTVSKDSFPLGLTRCDVVGHGVDTELFRPPEEGFEQGSPGRPGPHPDPLPLGEGRGEGLSACQFPTPRVETRGMRQTRFLSLSRISPRKDLNTMITAADILANRWGRRDARFVVAGGPLIPEDHDYYARVKARVRELGLEALFDFTGAIPHSETVGRLQACDFFVNMHVEGGLGKAVLEAMSCGKPAFVSTPTYYDRFPKYGGAFLFSPRDPEDLARKMRAALDMPREERGRVGRDLREWVVQEHDVRRQMSRIVHVLRAARGGTRPSASA